MLKSDDESGGAVVAKLVDVIPLFKLLLRLLLLGCIWTWFWFVLLLPLPLEWLGYG